MKLLTVGLILSSVANITSVANAGTERGGGNLLEAAFYKAIAQIESEIGQFGKRASQKLKFDSYQYSAAASGISVLCAYEQEDLEYLKKRKRLAFVKNPGLSGDKTIYLNCYNELPSELALTPDWNNVLNSILNDSDLSSNSKVLITHEVFRAGGLEIGEGDYQLSSSIKAAQMEQDRATKEQLQEFLKMKRDCWLQLDVSTGHQRLYIQRWFDEYRSAIIFEEIQVNLPEQLLGSILNMDTSNPVAYRALKALRNAQCYDNR